MKTEYFSLDERLAGAGIYCPLVSVIITNYNYGRFVLECIRSVENQSYRKFECIIIDDSSSDGSPALIRDYLNDKGLKDRFRLVEHKVNKGQMAAFKTGVSQSTGDFIVFVDADDILLDDFLITHLQIHLNGFPVAFTSCNQYQINERNELICGYHTDLRVHIEPSYVPPTNIFLHFWVWATTSSMMFRKAILDLILPEDGEHFRVCADYYVCLFSNMLGGSVLIPSKHSCYRRHGANHFSTNPVLGGRSPTGDMRCHPEHSTLRTHVAQHILAHADQFMARYSEKGLLGILLRVLSLSEIVNLLRVVHRGSPEAIGLSAHLWFRALLLATARSTRHKLMRYTVYLFFPRKAPPHIHPYKNLSGMSY